MPYGASYGWPQKGMKTREREVILVGSRAMESTPCEVDGERAAKRAAIPMYGEPVVRSYVALELAGCQNIGNSNSKYPESRNLLTF